jgi:hypothetical protein
MKPLVVLVISLTLLSQSASAETFEEYYRSQVTSYANASAATKSMVGYGFRDNSLNTGYIVAAPDRHYDVVYRLKAGYAYAFIGVCDEDCRDVDLTVYDTNGNKIAENIAADDNPWIWIFVVGDGEYRIRATVPKCNAPIGCYVAIKSMYK